jgi:hypothetical protein
VRLAPAAQQVQTLSAGMVVLPEDRIEWATGVGGFREATFLLPDSGRSRPYPHIVRSSSHYATNLRLPVPEVMRAVLT